MNGWWAASVVALWVVVLFVLALCLVLFRQLGIMVMGTARGVDDSGIPSGRRVPSVEIATLEGDTWTPESEAGRPFIVFFGSPQCTECSNVMPLIRSFGDTGEVRVVSLIFGAHGDVASYAARELLPNPVAAIDDRVARRFDVEATPFAYAVDARGVILMRGLANAPERLVQFAEACTGEPLSERALVTVLQHGPVNGEKEVQRDVLAG